MGIDWNTPMSDASPSCFTAGRRGVVHGCWKASLPGSYAAGSALHPKMAGAPCTGAVLEVGVTAWRSRAPPGGFWGRHPQAELLCVWGPGAGEMEATSERERQRRRG